jgi:hypothetical protein
MEAFEVTYDEKTKKWIKRPCTKPREVPVARRSRTTECVVAAAITLQVIGALWLLIRWRS